MCTQYTLWMIKNLVSIATLRDHGFSCGIRSPEIWSLAKNCYRLYLQWKYTHLHFSGDLLFVSYKSCACALHNRQISIINSDGCMRAISVIVSLLAYIAGVLVGRPTWTSLHMPRQKMASLHDGLYIARKIQSGGLLSVMKVHLRKYL